jgi:hypothetical protein
MAYKTFTNGSILTDTDLNTYLMKQTVVVCTSGTRPGSPPTGMLVYETDTGRYSGYTGSVWVTVWEDSGVLTAATAGFTVATGFTSLTGDVRKVGKLCAVDLIFTTTNSLAAGDIANTTCVNIPAAYAPSVRTTLVCAANGPGLFAYASGTAVVIGATAATFGAGSTVSLSGTWMLA